MDKINWKALGEISKGKSGVYLIEWEDGMLKFGSATDIRGRVDELTQLRRREVGSSIRTSFGSLAEDPETVERAISRDINDSVSGWIMDGTPVKEVLRHTEGKSVDG